MKIPVALLGEYSDVSRRVRGLDLGREGSLPTDDVFGAVVDVNDYPLVENLVKDPFFGGTLASPLIVVREKRTRIEGTHFRSNVLREAFLIHVQGREDEWYAWCFEAPWRFLLVLGDGAPAVFYGGLRRLRAAYLETALSFAPVLNRVGKRLYDIASADEFSAILSGMATSAGEATDERTQRAVAAIRDHLAGPPA